MELTNINTFNSETIFFQLSNNYCVKGTLNADEGMLQEALDNFSRAIEANPNNYIAYFNRATIKIDLGDLEGAKNDFNRFDFITKNEFDSLKL